MTVDFKNSAMLNDFGQKALERQKSLQEFCYEIRSDLVNISTDEDYLHKIIGFFRMRRDRSADARSQ